MPTTSKPLIYLASASPRRSALLTQIGVSHAVSAVDIDETELPGEAPYAYVSRLAQTKAQTLWDRLDSRERLPVLGSDTTVALGHEIFGKPLDRTDYTRVLNTLSGRTHQVFTAVALRMATGMELRVNVSEVTFRVVTRDEIDAYWETGEPQGKAGSYAIQGLASVFIERMSGSQSGIMGLPLFETAELLQLIGWRVASSQQAAVWPQQARAGAQG